MVKIVYEVCFCESNFDGVTNTFILEFTQSELVRSMRSPTFTLISAKIKFKNGIPLFKER